VAYPSLHVHVAVCKAGLTSRCSRCRPSGHSVTPVTVHSKGKVSDQAGCRSSALERLIDEDGVTGVIPACSDLSPAWKGRHVNISILSAALSVAVASAVAVRAFSCGFAAETGYEQQHA
jgi:hypothetical protein